MKKMKKKESYDYPTYEGGGRVEKYYMGGMVDDKMYGHGGMVKDKMYRHGGMVADEMYEKGGMITKKEQKKLTQKEERELSRQWIKFYREHKWVQQENGRWKFVKFELTKVEPDSN